MIEGIRAGSGTLWLPAVSLRLFVPAPEYPDPDYATFGDPAFVMIGMGMAGLVSAPCVLWRPPWGLMKKSTPVSSDSQLDRAMARDDVDGAGMRLGSHR